jgi:hypothetical protein
MRPRTLVHVLIATVGIVCAVLMLVLGPGCVTPRRGTWSAAYDQPWNEVVACWQRETGRTDYFPPHPTIGIRTDCVLDGQGIGYWTVMGGRPIYGNTLNREYIEMCQDLWPLRHELSHAASGWFRGHLGTEDAGNGREGKCGI